MSRSATARRSAIPASVIALLALAPPAGAQPTIGYDLAEATGGFEDIRGQGRRLPITSDRGGLVAPLPFAFPYFDTVQVSVGITSEGYLTFGGAATNTPGELPSATPPNGVIAPFWANLNITRFAGARIDMHTLGSAPARRFVVQWSDMPLASDPGARLTFQAVLYEGTGAIEFRYGSLRNGDGTAGGPAAGATATIGIEDVTGERGVLHSRNAPAAAAELRLVFTRAPARAPELAVATVVAPPGAAVEVPIELSAPVRGLRGYQATFTATPEQSGAPPLAVRAVSAPAAADAPSYVTERALATTGPLRLVLPVALPGHDGAVPERDGPWTIGSVTLVVPADAIPGSVYRLELGDLLAADPASRALAVTSVPGRLIVTAQGPAAAVDRLDLIAPPRVIAGEPATLEVIATAGGVLVPGLAVSLLADPAVVNIAIAEGVTDADGRFVTTLFGAVPTTFQVFATAGGVQGAVRIAIVDPAPPTIVSTPPPLATVGSLYAYDATAQPAGFAFDLEAGPPGMTITSDGALRWVPGADQVGTHSVTIRVVDTSTRQTFSVLVEPVPVATVPRPNLRPTITTTPPPTSLLVGETFTYDVDATDPDGDPLAFSLSVSPAGLAVTPTEGVVTWTPTATDVGEQRALVLVSDGRGGINGQGLIFTVTPPPEDEPPVITSTPPLEAPLEQDYVYQVIAEDPEEKPLTYRLAAAPDGMEINPATGEIRWFPSRLDDVIIPPQQVHVSGDTIITLGGDVANLVHGRFEDPTNLVLGILIESRTNVFGYMPSGRSFGWVEGRGPAGPGGLLFGYGDQRDLLYVWNAGSSLPVEGVRGGNPEFGLIYDLQGPANKVVVFPLIDHGPLPGEALEHTVYLSDDRSTWTRARLELVYEQGWHPDPAYIADGMVGVYALPSNDTFRYASVVWGGPAAIRADFDTEIDAVAGLTASGRGVGGPSETGVIVEVIDPAGNVVRQEFELAVPGQPKLDLCPDSLDFGEVPVGSTARRHVLVDNSGTMTLRVETVEVLGGAGVYGASEQPVAGEAVIEVEFAPAEIGAISSVVHVITSGGSKSVPVTGRGIDLATTAARPEFLTTPPVLAAVGRDFVYTARASDPLDQGLSYALESGPEGMRVHPVSGVLRWEPQPAQTGVHSVSIAVTDASGTIVRQQWCLIALDVQLEVDVDPRRAPVGTNEFDVTIRIQVEPPRLVDSSRGPVDRLIVEHTLPPGVELVPRSLSRTVEDVVSTPDGTVLRWRLPLDVPRLEFAVRQADMAPGTHAMSLETRARLAVDLDETPRAVAGYLRTISTALVGSSDPRGLGVDPASRSLLLTDPAIRRLVTLDARTGDGLGSVATEPGPHDVDVAPISTQNALVVDTFRQRLYEVTRSSGAVVRSTRTDAIGPGISGFAVDPVTNRRFLASPNAGELYLHDARFGAHVATPGFSTGDVALDPTSGELVAVDQSSRLVYRLDPSTGEGPGFALDAWVGTPSGVGVAADGEIHVVTSSDDRIYTYGPDGGLRRSTRIGFHTADAQGLDVNPATGEFLLADDAQDRVIRIGPELTRHVATPGASTVGLDLDPATGELVAVDQSSRLVYRLDPSTGEGPGFALDAWVGTPSGVGVAADGEIHVVTSSDDRVYTYGADGELRRSTRIEFHTADALGLDVDPVTGEFLLADDAQNRVIRLGPELTRHVATPGASTVGLDFDPATGDLVAVDQSSRLVYRLDPSTGEGPGFALDAWVGTPSGVGVAADGEIHVVTSSDDRVYTYGPDGGLRRSTRISFHTTNPLGLDVDPVTGEFLLTDDAQDRVIRLGPELTRHVATPGASTVGLDFDPVTGDLVAVDQSSRLVYRLNPSTGEGPGFPLDAWVGTPSGVGVAADGEIHVVTSSDDRIYTYGPDGGLRRSTRVGFHTTDALGLDVDPVTGEFLLTDDAQDRVIRLGPELTRHVATPGSSTVGLDFDPATGDLVAVDQSSRLVYRLDPSTGEGPGFALDAWVGTPSGVGVAADGEIHVVTSSDDRVYTYGPDGGLRRSTRIGFHTTNALGLDVSPVTGEFLLADGAQNRVIRLGPELTRHVATPGASTVGLDFDPVTGDLVAVDKSSRLVYRLDPSTGEGPGFALDAGVGTPSGVGVAADGEIHVVTSSDDRIYTYGPDGGLRRSTRIGFHTTHALGLDVDPVTGEFLLADDAQSRVIRLGPELTRHVATPGASTVGLDFDPATGDLVAVDDNSRLVYRLDPSTGEGPAFALGTGVGAPSGVAVAPDGEIHVASWSAERIYTYGPNGGLRRSTRIGFHTTDARGLDVNPVTGEFLLVDRAQRRVVRIGPGLTRHIPAPAASTRALGRDPATGELLALDSSTDRVYRLDPSTGGPGTFVSVGGRANDGIGVALSPDGTELHVLNRSDDTLYTFSAAGTFLRSTSLTHHVVDPQGLAVDPSGRFVLTDRASRQLIRLGADLSQHVALPTTGVRGLAWDPARDALWLVDASGDRVYRRTLTGDPVSDFAINGQTRQPHGLAVDPQTGDLLVVSSNPAAVFRYSASGSFLGGTTLGGTGPFQGIEARLEADGPRWFVAAGGATPQIHVYDPANATAPLRSFSTTPFGCFDPEGLATAADGEALAIVDGTSGEIYEVTPEGELSRPPVSTRAYGALAPSGVTFDGTSYRVPQPNGDPRHNRLFAVSPSGLAIEEWSTGAVLEPRGVAIGQEDTLWVVDATTQTVRSFDAAGAELASVATAPYGAFTPGGVAFDGTRLIVADAPERRLFSIDPAGLFSTRLSIATHTAKPADAVFGPDGTIYVNDLVTPRVLQIDAAGELIWSRSTAAYGSFTPAGLASDGTRWWVTDVAEDRLFTLEHEPLPVSSFSVAAHTAAPRDVTFGPGDQISLVDTTGGRVLTFGSSGELVSSRSTRAYGFFSPTGLTFDGAQFVVTNDDDRDVTEDRLFRVALDGLPTESFSVASHTTSPSDVSIGPGQTICVVDHSADRVLSFTGDGAFVASYATRPYGCFDPVGMGFDGERFLVADTAEDRLFRVALDGLSTESFSVAAHTAAPRDVTFGPGDQISLVDTTGGRVLTFGSSGELVSSRSTRAYGLFSPTGLTFDGAQFLVTDVSEDRLFRVALDGLPTASFSVASQTTSPSDVSIGPDQTICVVDRVADRVLSFTEDGAFVAGYATRPYGCFDPVAMAFDGERFLVSDTVEDRIFGIALDGLPTSILPLSPHTSTPSDVCFGPDGTICVTDRAGARLLTFDAAGALRSAVSTAAYGFFTPDGLAFDGTRFRLTDTAEDRLFAVDPSGLSVSTFSTAALGATGPSDVAWSAGGRIAFVDRPTAALFELDASGELCARHDLRELGIFAPSGLGRDAAGDFRITDDVEDRIFPMGPDGTGLVRIDLVAQEIEHVDGLAFDPIARTLFMSNDTTVWEACVDDMGVLPLWTLELSLYDDVGPVADIAVDRTAEELYVVSPARDLIYVFPLPRRAAALPARVLLLHDGHGEELARALTSRGHDVLLHPLEPGVLERELDLRVSQVWIAAQDATTGPVLTEGDLAALDAWRTATERSGVVLDGTGGRDDHSCAHEIYTQRIASQVEQAGGGLVLVSAPEAVAAGGAPDGSGGAVAPLNQVLDLLGARRITGAYETRACAPTSASGFELPELELVGLESEAACRCAAALVAACDPNNIRRDVLVGTGEIFDQPPALRPDDLLGGGVLRHPELPFGPQPGLGELFVDLEADYTQALAGSPELPGHRAHLLTTTIGTLAGLPDVVVGPQYVEIEPIVSIVPVAQTTVPLGTSLFAVTVRNLVDREADFTLAPEGLPPGYEATFDTTEATIPPLGSQSLLLSVSAPITAVTSAVPVTVRAHERFSEDDVRDRGSATATLHVEADVLTLPLALEPAHQTGRAGEPLTVVARLTNPRPEPRRFSVDLLGVSLLQPLEAPASAEVVLGPGEEAAVAFTFTPTALPGDYVLTARARALEDPGLIQALATAAVTVLPPNQRPVAAAGPDRTLTAFAGSASVVLDGRGSFDPDGHPLTYRWTGPTGTHTDVLLTLQLPPGVHTYTLVVSDGIATSEPDEVVVRVGDTTPPEIGPQPDLTVEQTTLAGTPVEYELVVSDDVGAGFVVGAEPASGALFPLGSTEVTALATDAQGNEASTTFTVRVVDTTPPVLPVLNDLSVETDDESGAVVEFGLGIAVDACDAAPLVVCSPPSGSRFPLGETTVVCTASDASGNQASGTFVVRVELQRDREPPTLTFTAPPAGALLASRSVLVELTYADAPDGTGVDPSSLVVTAGGLEVSDAFTTEPSGAQGTVTFPGDGPVTLRASVADHAGNRSAEVALALVVDTTPPELTLVAPAAPVVVEQAALAGTAVALEVSASDAIDPSPAVTRKGPDVFPLGTSEVTFTARDAAGNAATLIVPVTVQDTTPPLLAPVADVEVEQTALAGTPVHYALPLATDLCDAAPSVVADPPPGAVFPLGETVVRVTASDASGNAVESSFVVRVVDTTAPLLLVPAADLVLEATGAEGAVVTYPPIAVADACDAAPIVECAPPSGSLLPVGVTTVLCEASDASGNSRAFSFTVTVLDTTPPTLAQPAHVTVEQATAAGTGVAYEPPAASDLVDGALSVTCTPPPGTVFPLGASEVECTAVDAAGNAASVRFTVTVVDTTPPVLAAAPDVTVEATGPTGAVVSYATPSASDVCDAAPAVTCEPASGSTFPLGTTTLTCTALDASGNRATTTFTVTVVDTTPPTLAQPANVTVEQATGAGTAVVYEPPAASDLVDGALSVTCVPPTGTVFPLGASEVVCTAVDAGGNAASVRFTVTVVDTTPPVLTAAADVTVEATGPTGAVVSYATPSASDVCDAAPAVTCEPASGSTFPLGTTTVTCTALDASGNRATTTFTVTVVDTTPPTVAQPADVTVEQATGAGTAVAYEPPAASDLVDGAVSVTCVPPPGTVFPLGAREVVCTAVDAAGNAASVRFTVTVVDTTPPVFAAAADVTVEATGPTGAVASYATPSASDVCDAAPAVTCEPAAGSTFPLGTTTVTCTALDASGNRATTTFTVTVLDTTPPTLAQPADVTVEQATGAGTAVTYEPPAASDLVDGAVSVTCVPPAGTVFPLGASRVECTAVDAAGNAASVRFTVTVVDTTPPVLAAAPDVTVEATGPTGAVVSYVTPSASDVCDAAPAVTCEPASGSTFPLGATTVTCTAVDASGNRATTTFTVTVADTTPPTLAQPAVVTVEQATGAGTAVAYEPPAASDLVDGAVSVTCVPPPGTVFPLGASEVECTAVDAAGNAASVRFTVTVVDTTPPVLAAAADVTVEATGPTGAVVSYATPSASDVCDAAPAVTCEPASGSTFPLGTTTVTCTALDASGNRATTTFTVTVADTTPPTLAQPADVTVEQATGAGTAVAYEPPAASDLVDGALGVTCAPPPGTVFPLGASEVECTAVDAAGNAASVRFTVTVVDTTPPVLAPAPDLVLEATSAVGATAHFAGPSATDVCDAAPVVTCEPASGSTFPLGTTTVTCTALDASGNRATSTFTVTVRDTTPPTLAQPADVTVEQATRAGTLVPYDVPAATDLVDGAVAVVCEPPRGTVFPLGATEVVCTAVDAAGNAASVRFTVTVVDTTPPVLTEAPDLVVEATGPAGAAVAYAPPSASDVCDAAPAVTCEPAAGSTFPLGTTTVTCTALDASGNRATTTFTVTVRDTTPPTLAVPADVTVEQATRAGTAVAYAPPAASDLVDGAVAVTCVPAPGTVFPLGASEVTCTATDAAGNSASVRFTVTVTDLTAPTLAAAPDLVVEATGPLGAVVTFTAPAASDVCDAAPAVTCEPPSGAVFPLGQTLVTCEATDASGNRTVSTFRVSVVDTTPPELAPLPDVTLEQATRAGTALHFAPEARDVVDPAPSVVCDPPAGTVFPLGQTRVTVTATDFAGNARTTTFTVTVVDTTPPVLTAPADVTVEQATLAGTAVSWVTPAVSDVCDASPLVVSTPPAGTVFPLGTTQVTCLASDASGNESRVTFAVTVRDTTPPVLLAPPPLVITAPPGEPVPRDDVEIGPWLRSASASDVCDAAPAVSHDAPAAFAQGATTTVTFRATDASGNTVTATSSVTVITLELAITAPTDGLCTAEDVTVEYVVTGSPSAVTLAGTRTRGEETAPAGEGPTYREEGDHTITVTAHTPRGSVSAAVRFSIDRTAPTVTITSPLATPYPGQPYPESQYRFAPPLVGEDGELQPNPASDLPIPFQWTAHDEDGITGDVAEVRLLLDGVPLELDTPAFSADLLCQLGLGVLGRHLLVVEATDRAGNVGRAQLAFEVVLYGPAGELLTIKPEALKTNGGVMTAFFRLPQTPTGCALDPTFVDLVTSSLRLRGLDTGLVAEPERVLSDEDKGRLILKFRRDALTNEEGVIGKRFELTGRFFSSTGPAFVARDEVKKNP